MSKLIAALSSTIADRKANPTPDSYTANLFAAGTGQIAQKVGEEAVETELQSRVTADLSDS